MTDPKSLRQVMENARNRKLDDACRLVFQRLCEVLGHKADNPADPIAWRLERSICVVEEVRGGKPASRRRRMRQNRGSVGTIKQWLTYREPTDGYVALVKAGLWHLLGEAIPLDFPEQFTDAELAVARYRIEDAKLGRVSNPFLPTPKGLYHPALTH